MTKALACAWAKDNIQVNAILPGWIATWRMLDPSSSHSCGCAAMCAGEAKAVMKMDRSMTPPPFHNQSLH
jgi:NAD(P)-dependent dehydrogenase (short-subunit alcohol dehydrogenase family)